MSVGPNPSGITPKIAITPVKAVQANLGQSANAGATNKTNPNTAGLRAAQNPGNNAQAINLAFNPAFMAATGAIAAMANKKKASDVFGDKNEGEGQVGLGEESELQVDALVEKDAAENSSEGLNASGSTSQASA